MRKTLAIYALMIHDNDDDLGKVATYKNRGNYRVPVSDNLDLIEKYGRRRYLDNTSSGFDITNLVNQGIIPRKKLAFVKPKLTKSSP